MDVVYTKVCTGRDGDIMKRGAGALCESMAQLSLGDQDEWKDNGWGFWDAETRIAMLEEKQERIEREGCCKWTNDEGEILWVKHADSCAAIMDEIKAALKSSMERAVASLETDRWMFEGESGKKI
jgi:hypothetical protein